jgi:serine/threonine protein kinase
VGGLLSKTFSKYQIQGKLPDSSPHHARFKAVQAGLDREVELRILHRRIQEDEASFQRFQREFRTLAALDHPGIIKVLDLGIVDGRAYYTTDLRDSRTFNEMLAEERRGLDPEQCLNWTIQILEALALLHSKGVIHRDLSLDSIWVDQTRNQAYLANFALLKILKLPSLTEKGFHSPTAGASHTPEEEEGWDQDERTDIYLIGSVLYQLLTGRRIPTTQQVLKGSGNPPFEFPDPSELRNGVPPQMDEVLRDALAYAQEDRPDSVQHLLARMLKLRDRLRIKNLARTVGLPTQAVQAVRAELNCSPEPEDTEEESQAETAPSEASLAAEAATEAAAKAVGGLVSYVGDWFEESPNNKYLVAGAFGVVVVFGLGLNWLTAVDPYEGVNDTGINRPRRVRVYSKKLDKATVRKNLADTVQQTMEDSTTPQTFESRWSTLKSFVKSLSREHRMKHFPPSVMANLRVGFYRSPEGASKDLDRLLAKAQELIDKGEIPK